MGRNSGKIIVAVVWTVGVGLGAPVSGKRLTESKGSWIRFLVELLKILSSITLGAFDHP
jgi:uncharacterized membrane protein AbrB (regulator of aidB expression)